MPHLKWRRHGRLLLLLALLIGLLIVGAGEQPIVAYTVQDVEQVVWSVIDSSHALAAFVDAAVDGIRASGAAHASGAANVQ